jgi:hypothetical protein
MDTFNNLGMPIILSDEPKATVENPNPIIFLVLGTATFLVDFQYSTEITGAGNLLNNTKSVLEPSELKRVVTSYTVYLAGSGRAVVNRVYSTKGVAPDKAYKAAYNEADDKDTWFARMKEVAEGLNFCTNMKEYKANPDAYVGSIADFSSIVRMAVTNRKNTPDIYSIMQLLGKDRTIARMEDTIEKLK